MELSGPPGRKPGVEIALNRPIADTEADLVAALRENGDCTRGEVGRRDCPRLPGGDVLTAREAVAILMDRHGEALMRYLVGILRDRELAEDAFQDTWVRVMEKSTACGPANPSPPGSSGWPATERQAAVIRIAEDKNNDETRFTMGLLAGMSR